MHVNASFKKNSPVLLWWKGNQSKDFLSRRVGESAGCLTNERVDDVSTTTLAQFDWSEKDRLTSQISLPLFSQRLDPVSSIVCTMSVLKKERDLLPRRFGHVFRSIFKKVSKKKKRKSLASFDRYFVSCCHIDIKAIETQVRKEAVRRERKKNRKKKSWLEVSLITH